MSDDVEVQVKGIDNFVRTMDKAAEAMTKMETANRQAASVMQGAARSRAPRRSGALASSIQADPDGGVFADIVYAGAIHWGWPARNIDPQPWAMDAARSTEPQWIKYYEDEVQKALDGVKGE